MKANKTTDEIKYLLRYKRKLREGVGSRRLRDLAYPYNVIELKCELTFSSTLLAHQHTHTHTQKHRPTHRDFQKESISLSLSDKLGLQPVFSCISLEGDEERAEGKCRRGCREGKESERSAYRGLRWWWCVLCSIFFSSRVFIPSLLPHIHIAVTHIYSR